ncbi:lethal(2) giant larvae protein homolog 1 isoform X2 [Hetaerina americana]|uniref:lethal(2) giant larvae protein homolog 1 isoform X2 n=1 Tax=Hetaerina americana TaxID=62018 RepID=UPI003A7F1121
MLKFIRGKGQQPSAERQKVQRELFSFKKTIQHGFPNKPSSLAWDPTLRLMAIGTSSGVIKVLGKPGVEFYGQHQNNESAVTNIVFLPNQGRLVSLCADNSIHLWEINEINGTTTLEEKKIQSLEGKLKKISACHLESSAEHLLLGTEGGNIYLLNLETFEMSDTIIYQDVVMQNVPEDYKKNPGAVEAIAEQPGNPDRILIGYNKGLMVLWNRKTPGADQTYISSQQLESVCWHSSGKKFSSSHNDGSYAFWDVDVGDKPSEEPTTLYGPFSCKSVTKFLWKPTAKDDYMLFSGGMPRSSFSDRHTISVLHGKKHVVFDFTSKVIDFFTIDAAPKDSEESNEGGDGNPDAPEALIVLAEEELVAIDLRSEDWLQIPLPYLAPLHGSAITCVHHVSNVPDALWVKIDAAGREKTQSTYSDRAWPIDGGHIQEEAKEASENGTTDVNGDKELLLTGHEDGSIRFWDSNGISLKLLYKFSSSELFTSEEGIEALDSPIANGTTQEDEEESWPPFRKVGTFDPYSDDPRLAIKKISLCPQSGTLAIAGTAGHIIIAKVVSEPQGDGDIIPAEPEVKLITMNIVSDRDGFLWKGHDPLSLRKTASENCLPVGFRASAVLQLHPPAAVTSLALHSQWGVVAAGTAHGLALFDYKKVKPIITKCTLNPNDLSGAGDAPISRRKSFKKSLRESFRRLRKGRSQRSPAGEKRGSATATSPGGPSDRKRKDLWSAEKGLHVQDSKLSSSPSKDNLDKTNASPSPVLLQDPCSLARRNSAPILSPYTSNFGSLPDDLAAPNTACALPVALSMPDPQTNRASTLDSRAMGEKVSGNIDQNSQSLRTEMNVSRPVLGKIGLECIKRTRFIKDVEREPKENAAGRKIDQPHVKGGWQRIRALVVNRRRATTPTRIAPWVQADPSLPREPSKWEEISNSSLVSLGLGASPEESSLLSLAFIDSSPVVTPASPPIAPMPTVASSLPTNGVEARIASLPLEEVENANVVPSAVKSSIAMYSPLSASGSGEMAAGDTAAPAASPTSPASTSGVPAPLSPAEARPIERQVEARPLEDSLGSMVRCLYFARSFIVSAQTTTPTLWAGTNNGTVFVFTITVPNGQKRMEEDVSCQLGKEIQLKHRAPVISITVVDGSAVPLPEPLEIEKGVAPQPDNSAPHKVLICSEEQFKMFSLPGLKPLGKLKLTAHEGARVRRVGHARFYAPHPAQTTSTPYSETCLLSLTNLGDLIILSLPDLRRQLVSSCIRREDINGISSLAFTRFAEAFYLHSSSELQRVTLSATKVTKTNCSLLLPENARPKRASQIIITPQDDIEVEVAVAVEEEKGEVLVEGVVAGEPSDESKQQESSAPSSESTVVREDESVVPKPTVNGCADVDEKKDNGPKENGGTLDDEELLDMTGDITVDSVKDHLITSMNDDKIVERKTEKFEISSSKVESSVIVKTTTISSSEVATVINSSGETVGQEESPNRTEALPSRSVLNEISVVKRRLMVRAPLAIMEDLEEVV